jgi:SCP-2 sterol transfer family
MSTPGAGAAPATQGPSSDHPAPGGVVTLIVGEAVRASSSRSRARPGASRADAAKAGGQPGTATGSEPAKSVPQWSVRWSGDGPGPLLPSPEAEPDLTLTIGTDDAHRVKRGQLDPSVAFMQGKLKSTGNNALLLSILAWSATPAFAKALAEWSAGQTS